MTTPPPDLPPPPPPPPPERESRATGIALGVFTIPIALAVGLLAALLHPSLGFVGFGVAFIAQLFNGKDHPGYGAGIAWFFGVALVIFTACTVIVLSALG